MTTRTATTILSIEIETGAPGWVELLPAGPEIAARDGRRWKLADPQTIIDAFATNQGPLAIDYEHAQARKAPQGDEAPAAGWINELEIRHGAIWGRVEWTEKATAMITAREYRFLSPEFIHTKDELQILALRGAGLVNRPALIMTALSRQTEENTMPLKAIAKALGLAEDSDEKAILAHLSTAATARAALLKDLDLDADAKDDAIAAAITALKSDHATALAAAKDKVPATELTTLATKLETAETALAALQKKDRDREIDAALDAASAAGKITPASRDQYRDMCAAEGGLDRFNELVKTLPVIGDPSDLDERRATTRESGADDPNVIAAKARKYQDEQSAAGVNISTAEAVAHVESQA